MRILRPPHTEAAGDDEQSIDRQYQEIAEEVLSIAKAQLLVKLRFLDRALFELQPLANKDYPLASDGRHLIYDPRYLLKCYRQSQSYALRATAHMLMHSLFRHMFVSPGTNQELWDLACDIAAEGMVRELKISQLNNAPGQAERDKVLDDLTKLIRTVTAERIFRHFLDHPPDIPETQRLRDLFTVDDHALRYQMPEQPKEETSADSDKQASPAKEPHKDSKEETEPGSEAENTDSESPENGAAASDDPESEREGNPSGDDPGDAGNDQDTGAQGETSADGASSYGDGAKLSRLLKQQHELEQMWKDISEHVETDLETFAREQGFEAGTMEQALRSLNRERYDYSAFLRKFATMHEVMRLSPDEFDYVYYTYGLEVYKDTPLIEPLEYREDKRIRDFVIAIDTSGSVSGEIVQLFLQKTYNILKQEEAFDRRFNLHIIQCDASIQQDAVIHTQEEFDDYIRHMKLFGFGGTDFRPVFSYVEELRKAHAFTNLKGLLYFTDGYGTYPAKQTDYETAFVFLDIDADGQHQVPPWAIRVILETEDLER